MATLPPSAPQVGLNTRVRLGRDYYVRVAGNDYSVHPSVIGRFVDITADLHRVRIACGEVTVASGAVGEVVFERNGEEVRLVATGSPSSVALPPRGTSNPAIGDSSVLLPQPETPMTTR